MTSTGLGKRTTGLLQLTYSLVIAYGMFLTLIRADRSQIAAILLTFCLFIITGCVLETWGGLRPVSDFVRGKLYSNGYIYDADLRDEILYGRVRPKLFTSEPSAVTFAYTHYCAVWLAVSAWRYKYLVLCWPARPRDRRAARPDPDADAAARHALRDVPGGRRSGAPRRRA